MYAKIGYVVPTMGLRPNSLKRTVDSILQCKNVISCIVVAPPDKLDEIKQNLHTSPLLKFVKDEGGGLAAAINLGFKNLPWLDFWNWCADDDEVIASSIDNLARKMAVTEQCSIGIGSSIFVDNSRNILAKNRSNQFKVWLLSVGPNLVSQCACLFSYPHTKSVGLLNTKLKLAFDQDLIQMLLANGKCIIEEAFVGIYQWNPLTLSNSNRMHSIKESYLVRVKHSNSFQLRLAIQLLFPVVAITNVLGNRLLAAKARTSQFH